MTVTANALTLTIHAVAEVHRGFKRQFLTATQCTCPVVLTALSVLCVQFGTHFTVIARESLFEFFGHVVYNRSILVVQHRIVKCEVDIRAEIFDGMVLSSIQFLLDGAKIHGFLNDLEIIRKAQFHWIDRAVEHPTVLMRLKSLENFRTLLLQLLWWELRFSFQGLQMGLKLLNRKTFEERMIARSLVFALLGDCRNWLHWLLVHGCRRSRWRRRRNRLCRRRGSR